MSATFQCRACGSKRGQLILDLGVQPLANNLLRPEDLGKPEPKFPLRLFLCRNCWLLQIGDVVPPVQLFAEYLYFSSFSEGMKLHARRSAEQYLHEFALGSDSLVIEVASNDGYLLQYFQDAGVPCLGIEPAANIAAVAREKGIPTRVEFFGSDCGRALAAEGKRADLVLGNNVFAHAPEINDFLIGLREALKPEGRVILEFPHALEMLDKTEFDTIYHEHVFYFTLTALQPVLEKQGLSAFDVQSIPIHGGSLRLCICHQGAFPVRPSVTELLAEEQRRGVTSLDYYLGFAARVSGIKDSLNTLLHELKSKQKSVAAYGASAKGSTLLNYCGIGRETLDFVVDRSVYKQGRLTPGTHLEILPAEQLVEKRPDYTLLLTWNFADEILKQQQDYRAKGGTFIIPVPQVTTV